MPELAAGWYVDLISAQDDRGRPVESHGRSTRGREGRVEMTFAFEELPEGPRRLDLALALHQGHLFEFLVRPEQVPPGGSLERKVEVSPPASGALRTGP